MKSLTATSPQSKGHPLVVHLGQLGYHSPRLQRAEGQAHLVMVGTTHHPCLRK